MFWGETQAGGQLGPSRQGTDGQGWDSLGSGQEDQSRSSSLTGCVAGSAAWMKVKRRSRTWTQGGMALTFPLGLGRLFFFFSFLSGDFRDSPKP